MLVTGFNISLAVRDAIIMTVVADESQWDEGVISRFAAHPHDKDVAQSMSAMLTAAFEEPESDERRCVRVVELLHTMSGRLPAECTRQLRAVRAYLNGGVATSPRCTMRSGCSRRMNGSHWRLSSRLRSPDTSTRTCRPRRDGGRTDCRHLRVYGNNRPEDMVNSHSQRLDLAVAMPKSKHTTVGRVPQDPGRYSLVAKETTSTEKAAKKKASESAHDEAAVEEKGKTTRRRASSKASSAKKAPPARPPSVPRPGRRRMPPRASQRRQGRLVRLRRPARRRPFPSPRRSTTRT